MNQPLQIWLDIRWIWLYIATLRQSNMVPNRLDWIPWPWPYLHQWCSQTFSCEVKCWVTGLICDDIIQGLVNVPFWGFVSDHQTKYLLEFVSPNSWVMFNWGSIGVQLGHLHIPCMFIYTYIHIHTYIYTYIHTYTYIYIPYPLHIYICISPFRNCIPCMYPPDDIISPGDSPDSQCPSHAGGSSVYPYRGWVHHGCSLRSRLNYTPK